MEAEVMDRIARATGKERSIYFADAHNADDQVEAMKQGRLHITGVQYRERADRGEPGGFRPRCCVMAAQDNSSLVRDGNHRPRRQPDQDPGRPSRGTR